MPSNTQIISCVVPSWLCFLEGSGFQQALYTTLSITDPLTVLPGKDPKQRGDVSVLASGLLLAFQLFPHETTWHEPY